MVAYMPTYAGGLGVLAGDFVHVAADLGVPVVAVTLLHRKGYFRQRLDGAGRQHEEPLDWPIEEFVQPLSARVKVSIGGRQVVVRAWERKATGVGGVQVPVYFLDTDLPENAADDRTLTRRIRRCRRPTTSFRWSWPGVSSALDRWTRSSICAAMEVR
jgi:starch phosphorylase